MRGIGYTLSRLPTARALLAGAAILAGAFTSAAHGQVSGSGNGAGTLTGDSTRPDEAAWAVPRIAHSGAPGVAFPQPLDPSDVAVMRRVFAFQARGDVPLAVRSVAALGNSMLLGTVLADRYLGRYHRTTVDELFDWLSRYGDQPDAPAVHALLLTRLPKGVTVLPAPEAVGLVRSANVDPLPEDIDPPRNDLARNPLLDRTVLDRAGRGNTASALRLISMTRGISPAYIGQLRAEVAQVLFTRNEDADALRVAQLALNDTVAADQPSLGFYIGGLAAWRLDRIELARSLFEGGAEARNTSARLHAASAFWASRASRAMHDGLGTARWLRVAAEERLTFHGLLARRILRMDTGILPSGELLSQADVDAVATTAQGWRAFALLQIGQSDRAEAELRALWPQARANPVFGRSLMMVASAVGLTDCAAQMAALLQSEDGRSHDELRFPVPRLRPAGGFSIDPSLVYALTRLESNFDAGAISPAGARGLMQIMPATAQYITGDILDAADRLHEPSFNLAIGQRYIAYLARQDGIDNDLLRILASYNSGPGNFGRWGAGLHDGGDPLLFIEAIPVAETRAFVQHALLYSWIYAARMHLPASSLDALSAGEFPRFEAPRFTPSGVERKMAILTPGLK
ncbi:MAG: soluble lytic murein transglycosylase [Acetobacteraceae bacterium]|jgi:soluble lytic murein transglycosylase|nr:soluble lytic murein transglycosylase [Acetobacteraceae bacterium]